LQKLSFDLTGSSPSENRKIAQLAAQTALFAAKTALTLDRFDAEEWFGEQARHGCRPDRTAARAR
jgi:hypothetical protein